jgi:hypothetical protein
MVVSGLIALSQIAQGASVVTLKRPARPTKPIIVNASAAQARPSIVEIQNAVAQMQEQKRAFREQQFSSTEEIRTQARAIADNAKTTRQEFLQSLENARAMAKEQRKLAEEARTSVRRGR